MTRNEAEELQVIQRLKEIRNKLNAVYIVQDFTAHPQWAYSDITELLNDMDAYLDTLQRRDSGKPQETLADD